MKKGVLHRVIATVLCGAMVLASSSLVEATLISRTPQAMALQERIGFLRNQEYMRLETQALSAQAISALGGILEDPVKRPYWVRWIDLMNQPVHSRWPDLTWGTVGAAVSLILFAGLSRFAHSSVGAGLNLACGIFGLIWWLDPLESLWAQMVQIRDYFSLVMDAVASRGPQAAGVVLFVQNKHGDVIEKRFRLVNEKRVILSKIMIVLLQFYVVGLYLRGCRPLPFVEMYSHVRYATQGTRTHKNTHPLQFQPTTPEWSWEIPAPGVMERRTVRSATLIAKNGDVDYVWLYGQWRPQAEVKEWLIKVLNLSSEQAEKMRDVSVDSILVAGLMTLFIAQRRWIPAARLAYAFNVSQSITDRFPNEEELEDLAKPFEAAFANLQSDIKARKIADFSQFSEADAERLVQEVKQAVLPGIAPDKKEEFVRATVHSFLHMDPKQAMIFYLQRTNGHPDNSASAKVINTLYPHQIVFGAHKQPASIAFDPDKKRVAYASLEVALAGRIKKEGKTLPWILNLRDQDGEVLEMTPTTMRLYNMRLGRDYTAQELRDQHRLIPNDETNPYWSELPPQPKTTRVEQSVANISKVFATLRDDHNNPESWNAQTTDTFWDAVFRIGIFKDIVTKSRVNRIEDYASLADSIEAEAVRLLEQRKAEPGQTEDNYWEQTTEYARFVTQCVQAFDFVKMELRQVLNHALVDHAGQATEPQRVLRAAEDDLRARLGLRLADQALIDATVLAMTTILTTAFQQDLPERGTPRRRFIEDLALQVLDDAYLNPSKVHQAYTNGWLDEVGRILVEARNVPGELGYRHPVVRMLAEKIAARLPSFDTALHKTMDRRDPNIIILSHSEPLWMAEHFTTQARRLFPGLDVMTDTGNKMLASLHNPKAIKKRRHEFRLQLDTHQGPIRFGKRTIVIFTDQNSQSYMVKGSAAPVHDLFDAYKMENVFTQAGRFFTPLLTATGGVPHPDVPFNKHSWSTQTGWLQEEPKSLGPAAFNYQLSGRILPRGAIYMRTLFPTYPLLECKLSQSQAKTLWARGANGFVDKEIPAITGVDATGNPVATDANYRLGTIARRWANYVLEAALTDHWTWLLISLVAFFNFTPIAFMSWMAGQWGPFPPILVVKLQSLLHNPWLVRFANWLYYLPFMRWGIPFLLRLWQHRRKGDRRGKRTIDIAAPPHVRQTLEMFLRGLFSHQTYGSQSVQVEGGSGSDHFLLRFARVIVPGTLIFLHVPDGGRRGNTAGKSSAYMVGSQAKGIVSWGRGPEVVGVGEAVEDKPLSVDEGVSLGHSGPEGGTTDSNLLTRLEETIYGDLKTMIAGFVLFSKMAVRVSRFLPWMRWPLDSTLVGQDPTTRAPFGAPVEGAAATDVNESMPRPLPGVPLILKQLVRQTHEAAPPPSDTPAAPEEPVPAYRLSSWRARIPAFAIRLVLVFLAIAGVIRYGERVITRFFDGRPVTTKPSVPAIEVPLAPPPDVMTEPKKANRQTVRKKTAEAPKQRNVRSSAVLLAPAPSTVQPVLVTNIGETLAYLRNLQPRLPPDRPDAKNAVAVYIDMAGQLREISMASRDLKTLSDQDAPTSAQVSRLTSARQALERLRKAFSTAALKRALLDALPGESADIDKLWNDGVIDGVIESARQMLQSLRPPRAGVRGVMERRIERAS